MGSPHTVLRSYCHMELPGWRRMLPRVMAPNGWTGQHTSAIRPHGYRMDLDLTQEWERWSYMVGRYYEAHTLMLMCELLRPGEALVDVGANIGHVTLTGAWRVGAQGSVTSFEPNPIVFERVKKHVSMNGLDGFVTVHNLALADKPGVLNLSVPVEGTGGGTLGKVGSEYSGKLAQQYEVRVAVGDEVCAGISKTLVVKVDVEGFEVAVLKGLRGTIKRMRPAMLVEAWPEHLLNAGSSIEELFALAAEFGYQVYSVESPLRVRGFTRSARLKLTRLNGPGPGLTDDVLMLHPEGAHMQRVAEFIQG